LFSFIHIIVFLSIVCDAQIFVDVVVVVVVVLVVWNLRKLVQSAHQPIRDAKETCNL